MARDTRLDEALKRELSVKGDVDPRTLEKVLRGEPVRGMAGRRARRVLEEAGFDIPPDPAAPAQPPGRAAEGCP
jgi:hypothetical protein